MEDKICTHCGELKSVDEFYKNRGTKSGLASWCKLCSNESSNAAQKKYRFRYRPRKTRSEPMGQGHPLSKLTNEQVIEMRDMRRGGATIGEISNKYRISYQHCQKIVAGKSWKHLWREGIDELPKRRNL